MSELSWKAVRKGNVYCAPACGHGCKHSQYLKMKKQAELMCKALGKGWKPRVHENMGWHCEVQKSQSSISYYDDRTGNNYPDRFSAWVEIELKTMKLQFINKSVDMKKALEKSVKQADECVKAVIKELSIIEL